MSNPEQSAEQRTSALKRAVRKVPLIGPALAAAYVWFADRKFNGSASYWEERYLRGGSSGAGSYGELAEFKARVLNEFVARHGIRTVIEYGCGDGNQLRLADYPDYIGFDVSPKAIEICRAAFAGDPTRSFRLNRDYAGETAELVLSLDVIFHLVEDEVFESYMRSLFASATRFVIVYATNTDEQESPRSPHVRHRKFTRWVESSIPGWRLLEHIENQVHYDPARGSGSPASFFVYERVTD